ncbi:hypothetical protein P8H27_13000 [Pseudomonas sp. sp1636]|uniref:hypothetical protein n=1 Tax=Pseudomonas sp. sp1636 TaxID=3036707 RepID=UPI0025A61498|nr:hypothetical protein [Pseudomonas sp. sp1636]MDM8349806.1 hypothetical protein [Pseudomonas sp. sp1636]
MNSNVRIPSEAVHHSSGDIDLGELMMRVWAARSRVVTALLMVFALYCSYIAVSYFTSAKTVRYSAVFDLNFEGLSMGTFPNGSLFLMSDIINPAVLNRVYLENQLEEQGLKLDDFRRGVNIQPYAPDYALIRSKYEARLNDKKLSTAEIADLQVNMTTELKAARSSNVSISLQLLEKHSLPEVVANKVLLDIAQVWANRAINEQGVLKPSIPVYSERIFNKERFENLDYLLGIDLLLNSIKLVRGNIQTLKDEPNASTLIDDESGFTLADLDKAIDDVAQYDIRQIIDPIKELGISRNPQVVELYYSRRLGDLQQEEAMWQLRAQAIRNALGSYSKDANNVSTNNTASGAQNNMAPQLGDAFLDRLLEVSRQGSDLEFRQKLTQDVLDYEYKAIDIQQQVADIQRILGTFGGEETQANELRDSYVKVVKEQLPIVLDNLREYTRVMVRMYEKQGKQVAGNISQLIDPQGGSFDVAKVGLVSSRDLKIFAALMILTIFTSLFYSLLMDSIRQRKRS